MPKPNTHYFEVRIKIGGYANLVSDPEKLRLKMPVWTPGSYLVREFSRNVLDLDAELSPSGKKADSYKVSKNEWIIETERSPEIEIFYKVYAFELTVDTSYLDNLHAIINGGSVFVYVEGMENIEGVLDIIPFSEWKEVSTGLKKVSKDDFEFVFPNYDILIDSPIEIGNQKVHSFDVGGKKYEVSIFSQIMFDQASFVNDLRKIVETTVKVFQDVPYDKYLFLVDLMNDNSFGGLEHLNSTHCIAPVLRLDPPQEYHHLLSLFSHEFFHAWNVKRMRPRGLGPFDYSKETYTKSLWIAEGVTSYYDDLLIRGSGIYTISEYLESFSYNVSLMKTLPGARMQSAEEASFDSWIKHYRQNENSPNTILSYYTQGSVIGWMLDMEIRKSSGLSKTLDDAMRKTYRETFVAEGRGFSDEEFERNCVEVAGSDSIKEIFRQRVSGRTDMDYDKYLGYSALKLMPKKVEPRAGFLGVRLREESGKGLVSTVLSASSAETAGLSGNDEIVALNGIRMDKSRLSYYLPNRKPGELVSLTATRQGALIQLEARLTEKPTLEYRVAKKDEASEEERRFFQSWLGADWSAEIKYEDYKQSPSKTNLLEYV